MTTLINADTVVGGAIITGDASGALGLQAAGVTKLTVDSSGITLASALPIASGGTGQTTAILAFNALAPAQTSNSGKYLTTDGTNSSWATVNGGAQGFVTQTQNVSAAPTFNSFSIALI